MDHFKIDIGICTYKDNNSLKKCLLSLSEIDQINTINTVIIADNSPNLETQELVREIFEQKINVTYHYIPVSIKGIDTARNHVVKKSIDLGSDYLAFVDDDEIFHKLWLSSYIIKVVQFPNTVMTGPIFAVFDSPPGQWLGGSKSFEREVFPTGTWVKTMSTANCLIPLAVFKGIGLFDVTYDASGGGDTELSYRILKNNFKIMFVYSSIMYEKFNLKRLKISWLMKRNYRKGQSFTLILRKQKNYLALLRYSFSGLIQFLFFPFLSLILIFTFQIATSMGLMFKAISGLGKFTGGWFFIYKEYNDRNYRIS